MIYYSNPAETQRMAKINQLRWKLNTALQNTHNRLTFDFGLRETPEQKVMAAHGALWDDLVTILIDGWDDADGSLVDYMAFMVANRVAARVPVVGAVDSVTGRIDMEGGE